MSEVSPPRVLTLDGGGVRGLSSLLILREIMEDIERRTNADETPRPCEYFHLIGGTSTGGLIAIMLGRLGMVCGPQESAYGRLLTNVLKPTRRYPERSFTLITFSRARFP
jgi:Patatin-like phospholipase